MNFNRRQFLLASGMLGGFGLAVGVQRAIARIGLTASDSPISSNSQSVPNAVTAMEPPAEPASGMGGDRETLRLVVISDFNSSYGSTHYDPEVDQAIALIPRLQPDLVLAGGDMVAGQKLSLTTENIQAMWASFDRHVGGPLRNAGIPFGFTIGNHDGSGAVSQGQMSYQRERDLAAAHWNHPGHNPGLAFVDRANYPFYYTFQQNGVFYLVWDASTATIPAQQLNWVERSLASPAAQSARMRIVIGHLPLYAVTVGRDRPGEFLNNAEPLRSLLERYNVHTYISGHHHAYYPGRRGNLELLHAGAIGGGPRQLLNSNSPPRKTLTVVDVDLRTETTVYTTYDMQTQTLIDLQHLPRLIAGPTGTAVHRRDLTCADLAPAERSGCA